MKRLSTWQPALPGKEPTNFFFENQGSNKWFLRFGRWTLCCQHNTMLHAVQASRTVSLIRLNMMFHKYIIQVQSRKEKTRNWTAAHGHSKKLRAKSNLIWLMQSKQHTVIFSWTSFILSSVSDSTKAYKTSSNRNNELLHSQLCPC